MSIKQALCVNRQVIGRISVKDSEQPECLYLDESSLNQYGYVAVMQDRATCETDPSWQQLLPYITLAAIDQTDNSLHVLRYTRGQGGGEDRLKAKQSIGFGGHLDSPFDPDTTTLLDYLRSEAQREVQEEIGITLNPAVFTFQRSLLDVDAVGQVHFGLSAVVLLPMERLRTIASTEHGVIDSLEIVPLVDLVNLTAQYERLEGWSKLVAREVLTELVDMEMRFGQTASDTDEEDEDADE